MNKISVIVSCPDCKHEILEYLDYDFDTSSIDVWEQCLICDCEYSLIVERDCEDKWTARTEKCEY